MKIYFIFFFAFFAFVRSFKTIDQLEQLNDLTKSFTHLALVFADKKICLNEIDEKCVEHRQRISRIEEICENERVQFFLSTNEELREKNFQIYGKEEKLIFFRETFPIFYSGSISNYDQVQEWFGEVRERLTRTLDDQTFEHDTQAATGSTTGDWFILFQNGSDSRGLVPVWESLSIHFRNRIIFAYVDLAKSPMTQKRFHLFNLPTFLLFKRGKLYRYESVSWKESSFIDFAENLFRKSKAEPVPPEISSFSFSFGSLLKTTSVYFVIIPMILLLLVLVALNTGLVKKKTRTNERPTIQVKID